ncbi:MAG: ABC transporter permease, partial [Actinomycetes bacterium]
FFGWSPVQSPLGAVMTTPESLVRLTVIVAYIGVTMLFVASLAFCLSVWTDAPLAAVGGAVLLVVVSNILDQVTALGSIRNALPTHFGYAWTDALGPAISWDNMGQGTLWVCVYSALLLTMAWVHFLRKDIVS